MINGFERPCRRIERLIVPQEGESQRSCRSHYFGFVKRLVNTTVVGRTPFPEKEILPTQKMEMSKLSYYDISLSSYPLSI